jgi:hypothetical protein
MSERSNGYVAVKAVLKRQVALKKAKRPGIERICRERGHSAKRL